MRAMGTFLSAFALFTFSVFSGCSTAPKSPDVANSIRGALDRAGLKDVSVSEDRDKGVVTLGGEVRYNADKIQAESLAKPLAGSQVVADQIAVVPPQGAGAAKQVNADLDEGISKNLDALLIQNHLNKDVKGSVKNGVVTLTGEVRSQERRAEVQSIAASVPNVGQVVNELQVKDQKATSSELH
jgi:hyperosmotically inducible protein